MACTKPSRPEPSGRHDREALLASTVANADIGGHSTPDFQAILVRAIYEASPDGVLLVDAKGSVVSHNPQLLKLWDLAPRQPPIRAAASASGAPDAPLLAQMAARVREPDAFLARVRELDDNPQLDDRCEIELKEGRTLERHSAVLRSEQGRYLGRVWFFRDITVQKDHELVLIQLSRHDPLTGAANRRHFFERAEQEFLRARRYRHPLSLALLDIDHLKHINEQHGHAAGDEVLRHLSHHSRELLRDADLLARIGGEEFAILMPSTSVHGARKLAERLRQVMAEQPLSIDGQLLHVHFSAGVTQLRADDHSFEDCLRRADETPYRAKQAGHNRVEASA